jgi:hypothetical protein
VLVLGRQLVDALGERTQLLDGLGAGDQRITAGLVGQ